MIKAIGEMQNESGKDYQLANFVLSVYDVDGNLLETGYINISYFNNGSTKRFDAIIGEVHLKQIKNFKIQFENGF